MVWKLAKNLWGFSILIFNVMNGKKPNDLSNSRKADWKGL